MESLESFRTVLKVVGRYGRFPTNLEICQTVWKFSREFEKFLNGLQHFPDSLERFSGQSGRFMDSLESFGIVQKVSTQPGKFLDNLEGLQPIWKVSRQS